MRVGIEGLCTDVAERNLSNRLVSNAIGTTSMQILFIVYFSVYFYGMHMNNRRKNTMGSLATFALCVVLILGTARHAHADAPLLSRFRTGSRVPVSPAVGPDGTVYVGGSSGRLHALHIERNWLRERWSQNLESSVDSGAVISATGTIYIVPASGVLHAIRDSGDSGETLWTVTIENAVAQTPALRDDGVLLLVAESRLYAIDATNEGSTLWRYDAGGEILSRPSITPEGMVYVTVLHGQTFSLHAINPDGSRRWVYDTALFYPSRTFDREFLGVTVDSFGAAIVQLGRDQLYAIEADRTVRWRFQIPEVRYSVQERSEAPYPLLDRRTEFFPNSAIGPDNTITVESILIPGAGELPPSLIMVLDLHPDWSNGSIDNRDHLRELPSFPTQMLGYTNITIGSNGSTFIASASGDLVAIDTTGSMLWRYTERSGRWSSPVIGPDGVLFISSASGYVYAFDSGTDGLAETAWPTYGANMRRSGQAAGD